MSSASVAMRSSSVSGAGRAVLGTKIVAAEAILVAVPFRARGNVVWNWNGAGAASAARRFDTLLVRLETDSGLVGWGEVFSRNQDTALRDLVATKVLPSVIGKDPARIGRIKFELERELHNFGRTGPIGYAIGGVDLALWDLCGKASGRPLIDLIGGPVVDEVEVYASLLAIGDVEMMHEVIAEVLSRGYRSIKLHETDPKVVAAAVEAAGEGVEVTLDVNCPWHLDEALRMDRRLAPLKLGWLEEPIWPPENYDALRKVRAQGQNLIAAGENAGSFHDFVAMIQAGAIDIAQPDIVKVPGLTEMMRIATYCDATGVRFIPHCALFGPGMIATVHLNASRIDRPMLERLYLDFEAELFGEAAKIENARFKVPTAPGIGKDPDPNVIKEFKVL